MAGLLDYANTGMGIAQANINTPAGQMPSYVSSAAQSPTQMDYAGYTPNTPMATITAPDYQLNAGPAPQYQGLMGQDYNALQQSLYQPARIAAETAYNQGYNRLNDTMGARGLYGSSIMANQANQGLNTVYQNTLATAAANAAAQRYGMQQKDLAEQNSFNKDLYGMGLSREAGMNQYGLNRAGQLMTQEANLFNSRNTEAQRQQAYNQQKQAYQLQQAEAQRNWANQQQYEKYQYDLAKQQYADAQRTARINEGLALAGSGNQLSATNNAYDLAQQAANQASTNGYLGAAGTALGGLLGSGAGSNLLSSLGSNISNWLGFGGSPSSYYDASYVAPDFNDYTDWTGWGE